MAKKIKVDIQKFLDAARLIDKLDNIPITKIDFTCIFEKDLTKKQKKEFDKNWETNKLLRTIILFPKEFEKLLNNKVLKKYYH